MKRGRIILGAVILPMVAISCTKEWSGSAEMPADAITFSAYRQQVYTRADIGDFEFPVHTQYALFAVESAASEADYLWSTAAGFRHQPEMGEETSSNTIAYGGDEGVSVFKEGKTFDFFAVTYGEQNVAPPTPAAAAQDGVTPTVTISESSDRLPDLMHSNSASARNRSSAGGVVILPFEHALASLSFLVSKQDESGDSRAEQQLNNVQLKEIRLDNVAETASLNIVTGQWSWAASNVGKRIIYDETMGTPITLTKTAESIGGDILVFPNDDYVDNNAYDASAPYKYYNTANDASASKGEQILVTVKLTGLEQYDALSDDWKPMNKTLTCGAVVENGACEVSFPLRQFSSNGQQDQGPLHFLRNHKYQMNVIVERDNVQVLAVNPQVLEWANGEMGSVHMGTLGQPITFGGTVWMDRNLGATSADCEGDWLHTLGYFYQFGRNIPFIVDVDAFVANNYKIKERNGNVSFEGRTIASPVVDASGNIVGGYPDRNPAFPNYLVYTWDDKGNKVSLVSNQTVANLRTPGLTDGEVVAIDPGDTGTYAFISNYRNVVGPKYWYDENPAVFYSTHWSTPAGQPVPKGWRLPKKEDVYSIMPEKDFSWVPTNNEGPRFKGFGITDYPQRTSYSGTYQFFYGNIQVDPNASTTAPFSAPLRDENINITRVYGIKFQGTAKAYRYKIEMHTSNITDGKFVRFSLYPTGIDDIFLFNDDKSQWNLHQFDWEHESAHLDFPMQGNLVYSDPAMLELFGRDLKLTLSEAVPGSTNFYSLKLSNDGTGYVETYQATTCPTRLVRDL